MRRWCFGGTTEHLRLGTKRERNLGGYWATRRRSVSRDLSRACSQVQWFLVSSRSVLRVECATRSTLDTRHRAGRDSLAWDVLEPVRPYIDAYVLKLAREETFSRDDFFETHQGVCRLMPPLAQRFSETASQWAKLLHPIAHRVARRFERAGATGHSSIEIAHGAEVPPARLPALLRSVEPGPMVAPTARPANERRCRRCGATIAKKRRVYCASCVTALPAMASGYALTALRRRQREESGAGPSSETRALLGDARSQRASAIRDWENAHPTIPSAHVFTSDILPMLAKIRAQDVRTATGLCRSYCGRILRGQYVPHPMHWEALRKLGGAKR
jgi:ribosomal protein L37E